jgi:putative SbcD/Mre11-related phosphoesterase
MDKKISLSPVYGERALIVGNAVVLAELHIGLEHELRKQGVMVPSQVKILERGLKSLVEKTGADELIILGDVKHNIPSTSLQEYKEIPLFFSSLREIVDLSIVKGNHDGNLEKLLTDFQISEHLYRDGVLFTHGHSWIKTKSLDARVLVLAHSHPAIEFVDEFNRIVKEPAWIRGRFNEKIKEHYRVSEIPEFIVIPAFNPLISGTAFNQSSKKGQLGPYFRSGIINLEEAHAYLLDGTDLGSISNLKAAKEKTK